MTAWPAQDRRAGFTLLELLVAITLLGLLMTALFGGLQLGTRAWERGEARLDQSARLQGVQNFLRDRLSQSYPLDVEDRAGGYRLSFEGTADALRFVTLMPEHLGTGFAELVLALSNDPDPGDLVVRWRPFEVSRPASETADEEPQVKVLLAQVAGLELSYYGAPNRDLPAAWYDQWLEASVMPELVRLRVAFLPGDSRSWPELIVRPMTDAVPAVF